MATENNQDAGESIDLLQHYEEAAPPEFFARVARAIHRRTLAGDMVELGWDGPLRVALEYFRVGFESLIGTSKENQDGNSRPD